MSVLSSFLGFLCLKVPVEKQTMMNFLSNKYNFIIKVVNKVVTTLFNRAKTALSALLQWWKATWGYSYCPLSRCQVFWSKLRNQCHMLMCDFLSGKNLSSCCLTFPGQQAQSSHFCVQNKPHSWGEGLEAPFEQVERLNIELVEQRNVLQLGNLTICILDTH